MIDRLFSALLTFALLAGGTVAIGSALLVDGSEARVVTLPAVTVTGQRSAGTIAQNEPVEPATTQLR